MNGRYECVHAVLHHARGQGLGEGLVSGVEVAKYSFTLTTYHQADGVCFDPCIEDRHCPAHTEGSCAEICLSEADFRAGGADNVAYGGENLVATDVCDLNPRDRLL